MIFFTALNLVFGTISIESFYKLATSKFIHNPHRKVPDMNMIFFGLVVAYFQIIMRIIPVNGSEVWYGSDISNKRSDDSLLITFPETLLFWIIMIILFIEISYKSSGINFAKINSC